MTYDLRLFMRVIAFIFWLIELTHHTPIAFTWDC